MTAVLVVSAFTAMGPLAMRETAPKHYALRMNGVFLREALPANA